MDIPETQTLLGIRHNEDEQNKNYNRKTKKDE